MNQQVPGFGGFSSIPNASTAEQLSSQPTPYSSYVASTMSSAQNPYGHLMQQGGQPGQNAAVASSNGVPSLTSYGVSPQMAGIPGYANPMSQQGQMLGGASGVMHPSNPALMGQNMYAHGGAPPGFNHMQQHQMMAGGVMPPHHPQMSANAMLGMQQQNVSSYISPDQQVAQMAMAQHPMSGAGDGPDMNYYHPSMMPGGGMPYDSRAQRGGRGGYAKYGGGGERSYSNYNAEDNSPRPDTVYVKGLKSATGHEELRQAFSSVGNIKLNNKSGMPMIWIFKQGGVCRGDALVTYETTASADAAVKWYKTRDFNGQKIEVRIATNAERPQLNADFRGPVSLDVPIGGGVGDRGGYNSRYGGASRGNVRGAGGMRGGRGGFRPGGSSLAGSREGDWDCPSCNNKNFGWRESCNRCQAPKPSSGPSMGVGRNGGPVRGGQGRPRPAPY